MAKLVLLAIVVAALPAVFAFYPELAIGAVPHSRQPALALDLRVAMGAAWVAVLLIGASVATRNDLGIERLLRRLDRLNEFPAEQVQYSRMRVLRTTLTPAEAGTPEHYTMTIYIEDGGGRLVPSYPDPDHLGPNGERVFRRGIGATGKAFETGQFVVATGNAVSDAPHGLSPDQQAYFADCRSVASAPILRGTSVLGVVSAVSTIDDGWWNNVDHVANLRNLADDLAVVLTALAASSI